MAFLKVLGWIFVPYVMIFVSWKKLRGAGKAFGVVWALFAGFFLVFGILGGGTEQPASVAETNVVAGDTEKDSDSKAAVNAKETNVEDAEKHKNAVLEFEKTMYANEEETKQYFDAYMEWMEALGNGQANVNDVYSSAKTAKEAASHTMTKMRKIPIDKNLPKDVKKLLEEARGDLSTAYFEKEKAMKSVMKYLDEQKPSTMQDFKDSIQMSETFVLSAATKLLQAKNAVGIEVTEKSK
ncbi:hypothetical protein [Paenibacillus sp. NEAU-GSW1]|uniref:hypothetical protein n=1 Tax=Paenibacillus sp. NEAU-GSW1 TaxID=2682486 RepID=UPI0012E32BA7|nr:hypothetical protein [Paenibacillus sp. NEAU-GSW1]MUT65855.1 hypothetical protein [Paenibacillus sp. NEAU-GSW1]